LIAATLPLLSASVVVRNFARPFAFGVAFQPLQLQVVTETIY